MYTPLIHPMNSRDGGSYVTHTYTHYVINKFCQFHLEMHPSLPALGAHFLVLVVCQKRKYFAYVGKPLANTSKHLLGQTLLRGVSLGRQCLREWIESLVKYGVGIWPMSHYSWNIAWLKLLNFISWEPRKKENKATKYGNFRQSWINKNMLARKKLV